jgi:2-isopropylmalate synthase
MAGTQVVGSAFGVGIDANLITASIRAVISGINRAYARSDAQSQAHFFDAVLREVGKDGARNEALQAG